MATQASNSESAIPVNSPGDTINDTGGIGGHPRGLTTLFYTEMWERFSYYGMRALLTLYLTKAMGYDEKVAATIYGAYTGSVYLMSIPGGWIADNVLGTRNAVFYGGILIALGHFSMALPTTISFFLGLILIVFGTGLLKPNVSAVVGSLYSETDPRRDAGFSIFYMGINLGAFIAPLICGYLGEKINWHLGFGVAGVGMTLGLVQYYLGRDRLAHVGHAPQQPSAETKRKAIIGIILMLATSAAVGVLFFGPAWITQYKFWIMICGVALFLIWMFTSYLKPEEKKPVAVIVVLFFFSIIFWATFEQAGSSFTLFADRFTDRSVPRFVANLIDSPEFPTSWYQSVNSIFLILLAPVFSWLWLRMANRQPSSPIKFSLGLLFVGMGALLMVLASLLLVSGSKVGPWWLVGVYLSQTIGELCLSPVGLSTTTKLAPARLTGLMMGVWFLSISFGNFLASMFASGFKNEQQALIGLFSKAAAWPIIAAVILLALTPTIRKLMGKVR
ncbi:MAG: peptide MFS transporter [Acidobacteriota bacterium]|nr:peptide MFS transporter [Acidobacteriota bacterium]